MSELRFQTQGPGECQLATLAMLADIPLNELRVRAIAIITQRFPDCRNWRGLLNQPHKFWEVVSSLSEALFGCPFLPSGIRAVTAGSSAGIGMSTLPNPGRGQLTIQNQFGGLHAVAYCDGVVYDPDLTGPRSIQEYEAVLQTRRAIVLRYDPLPDPIRNGPQSA